jgi:hypothetical protein
MPKKKIVVTLDRAERKRNAPRTAFRKGEPNPHAFKPGVSPNPGGRPKDGLRLVSKALRVQLAGRATNEIAQAVGLDPGASYAQVLAQVVLRLGMRGDLTAIKLAVELSEKTKVEMEELSGGVSGSLFNIVFVESDGNGKPLHSSTIEAMRSESERRQLAATASDDEDDY